MKRNERVLFILKINGKDREGVVRRRERHSTGFDRRIYMEFPE
jgi:hypothetical protein